ncbi:uncharacterized protein DUF58 [Natranaerovirga pectinivora]|uniref:Uncharacterized protein DUF58 n=1 Tax=Natranaerovirga pectinivora TaxID=682400 RepID=A0A4R3MIQ6_9FIRM|nr:DUF58 domain-containing protein [Natranaerovirga pectinivora]TCT11605.1 uncharacterized protein DUF58 [Natranaerovirga pectinivora]
MWVQWLFISTFIFMYFQSWIVKKWGLKRIKYNRYFNIERVFVDSEVQMVEEIVNYKLLPIPWLKVESKINKNLFFSKEENRVVKNEEYHSSVFSLFPFMRVLRKYSIIPKKRGCYKMNSVSLTCGDFISLGKRNYLDMELESFLIVFPKLVPMEEIPFPNNSLRGDILVKRWIIEDPFMISGVREYHNNDSMKDINWSSTAKMGHLQVNKYDYTADRKLMILLNVDIREGQWEVSDIVDSIEKGISYCATVANSFITSGVETGFGTNGEIVDFEDDLIYIHPDSSEDHLLYMYELMAKLIIKSKCTFHKYLEEEVNKGNSNIDYMIFSAYMDDNIQYQINNLTRLGNTVKVIFLEE